MLGKNPISSCNSQHSTPHIKNVSILLLVKYLIVTANTIAAMHGTKITAVDSITNGIYFISLLPCNNTLSNIEINTLVVFLRYPYLGASNISEAKLLLFIGVTKRIRYPIDKYQP